MVCSEFIDYLVTHDRNGSRRLPPLSQISAETHLGIGKLREQMAVARALGLIEAAPKRGIECLGYDFLPAVRMSLEAGIALDANCFQEFADLRIRLEIAFWADAVQALRESDLGRLEELCDVAEGKLARDVVEIPHEEHREFHLRICSHLPNPFVLALLTAYWDVYRIVAPKYFEELAHLQQVWRYHRRIVQALQAGHMEESRRLHVEHMRLLELCRRQGESTTPVAGT